MVTDMTLWRTARPARLLLSALLVALLIQPVRALPSDSKQPVEESWEAVYVAGKKAGYVHTVVTRVKLPDGREAYEVKTVSKLQLRRFGQQISMVIEGRSVELAENGALVEVEQIVRTSNIEATRMHAKVDGDAMVLTVVTLGKESTRRIPWRDLPGPYALDRKIRDAHQLKEGESLEVEFFDQSLQAVVTGKVIGGPIEEVQLLDRTAKLRHLKFQIFPPRQDRPFITTDVWVDEDGETLKTNTPMLGGMTTYRVSKEVALAEPEDLSEDIAIRTLVPVKGQFKDPFETVRAVYRIHLADGVEAEDLPLAAGPTQSWQVEANGTILLTVRAESQGSAATAPPSESFLEPNSYIQSDNEKIRRYAAEAVGDATETLEKARRLERWVFENLKNKNYGVGFASAAAVAESMEGDCTEHAVLLAAMARAQGLPARVAVGFVFAPSVGKFGGHMWTEIFVNGHWRGFDATLGRGRLDAVHIKLGDSALDGADAMLSLLPIARAIEMIKLIELVEVEYKADD